MNAASNIGSVDLGSAVSMTMAKKSLDVAKDQGEAAVSLIEAAADVQASANDAAASGVGGMIDVSG